jgi:hypothetical protein
MNSSEYWILRADFLVMPITTSIFYFYTKTTYQKSTHVETSLILSFYDVYWVLFDCMMFIGFYSKACLFLIRRLMYVTSSYRETNRL